ncbi:MAG: hypothetical protein A2W61_08150 [Deltaproteobacteria bacterium RIFCSPLOWO2_01_44_7]|nr:MAG: hypothetical protein A2712_04570 [Deltaproteobacteria bacterium RIFCSPHIGHO2_01_FULL_43_49]OGQ16453.1 MAG: hypothetical protein A3D22_02535 [Deltaproteobacteria bacterium RIFCSPHIGHO2_02_FULL_44_53]OGQ27719.1 MAG: hypothetical protein A3D98_08450 [Deltaproteobacteria bacterium RIFCSPHIGHO2_12_FULL_44_21]OGQ32971.1 MAG: hypothetical protein A2979_10465 [Deltaproteobacteria bacterium RIFCSPLOWO2_01_FULL_45_74]OGQ37828.1 MAG: hypothetical protein A2W61_08150 [Deltaproteobacteria bacterium 
MKAGGQTSSGGKGGGSGLTPNISSLLCYVCAPITSVIFLLIEKENKDVKFHAWQGTLFGVAIILLNIVLNILGLMLGSLADFLGALILSFLIPVIWLIVVVLWIVCLVKAYQGEQWKIPVIGDMAAKKAGV